MKYEEILERLWAEQERSSYLITEYDSLPRRYDKNVLYQAEVCIIYEIGQKNNITITEIAEKLKKTTSACSQSVKKLLAKGLVEQTRNANNKRIYNLKLTEDGQKVYDNYFEFEKMCQRRLFEKLSVFTEEELEMHIKVLRVINEAYQADLERSKEKYKIEE